MAVKLHSENGVTGADPACQFDRCTVRLLKDYHTYFLHLNAGVGVLHFMNLIGNIVHTSPLVGILHYIII